MQIKNTQRKSSNSSHPLRREIIQSIRVYEPPVCTKKERNWDKKMNLWCRGVKKKISWMQINRVKLEQRRKNQSSGSKESSHLDVVVVSIQQASWPEREDLPNYRDPLFVGFAYELRIQILSKSLYKKNWKYKQSLEFFECGFSKISLEPIKLNLGVKKSYLWAEIYNPSEIEKFCSKLMILKKIFSNILE